MKRILVVLVAGTVLIGTGVPMATARIDSPMKVRGSGPATAQDYRELLRQLEDLSATLKKLKTLTSSGSIQQGREWQPDCRGYSPERTVRCAAVRFQPPGGVTQSLAVWRCETGWGVEPQHTDAYHGPFQYLYSTYDSQQDSIPNVVRWFELSAAVHDMRSNIVTAIAWAGRNNSWSPWSGCA